MRVLCPTCAGRGYIPDPKYYGRPVSYYNPHTGSCVPEIMCQTCSGSGWVTVPDYPYPVPHPIPYPDTPRPITPAPRYTPYTSGIGTSTIYYDDGHVCTCYTKR